VSRSPIPILLYHSVSQDQSGEFGPYAITPDRFREHLDLLLERGHRALTVSKLVSLLRSGAPVPERPVVITFDDGFADFADAAWPEMERRSLPATLYVTTGVLGGTSSWLDGQGAGGRAMLSWAALRDLADAGCEIGAHTVSHPPLDCIDRREARREILASRRQLEDGLERDVPSFAYPHGHHDRHVRRLVVEAGFDSACAVKNAMSHAGDDRFSLARITVLGDVDADGLSRQLDGRGVPRAPRRERFRTTAWRQVRRRRHRRANPARPA
jgi:peptidoglycan/xylan/chitin deacetylase (PgdA/CDA1 family)